MQGFVRMTKLPNISGRAGYISNPDKQEEIVLQSEAVDWQPYVDYEIANQKTDKKNNQGRELVISLPNEWYSLPREELNKKVQTIAETAVGKSTDLQWAVHWNSNRTNLHVHVIFSERQKEKNQGYWDRDVYLTEDGKIARRKADRATNPDGTYKPPIHKKGDLKGNFTAKDKQYISKGWLHNTKENLLQQYKEWGVQLDEKGMFHQFHEGKGSEAQAIHQKNIVIKENNLRFKELEQQGVDISKIVDLHKQLLKEGKTPVIYRDADNGYRLRTTFYNNPANAVEKMKETSVYRHYEKTWSEKKIDKIEILKERYDDQISLLIALEKQLKEAGIFDFKKKKKLKEDIEDCHTRIDRLYDEFRKLDVQYPSEADKKIEELKANIPAERQQMIEDKRKKPKYRPKEDWDKRVDEMKKDNPIEKSKDKEHTRSDSGRER